MRCPPLLAIGFAPILLAATVRAETEDAFVVFPDLRHSQADEICELDLFLPSSSDQAVPCVMVIQGGGFNAQTGQKFRPFAEELARHGFAAALLGYRGLSNHTIRETISDAKTAVRFVREISKEHGIDPDRIGAMGRSAGATITLLLATTGDDPNHPSGDEHQGHSHTLQAAAGIAGVYDFIARYEITEQRALQNELERRQGTNSRWIGAPFESKNSQWLLASAQHQLDGETPPLLLIHARDDETVPWHQSQNMQAAAINAGVSSQLYMSVFGGHRGPSDTMDRIVEFFNATLGN